MEGTNPTILSIHYILITSVICNRHYLKVFDIENIDVKSFLLPPLMFSFTTDIYSTAPTIAYHMYVCHCVAHSVFG